MSKIYRFNTSNKKWREIAAEVLTEKKGTLHLIDTETQEETDMVIRFMYTQLIPEGYYCDGIAEVNGKLGYVHLFLGRLVETYARFKEYDLLNLENIYDDAVRTITAIGDDMVRNSDAIKL